jgi:hypothetical protein
MTPPGGRLLACLFFGDDAAVAAALVAPPGGPGRGRAVGFAALPPEVAAEAAAATPAAVAAAAGRFLEAVARAAEAGVRWTTLSRVEAPAPGAAPGALCYFGMGNWGVVVGDVAAGGACGGSGQ